MASGDTLAILLPQGNEPPSANYPQLDERNGILVLDYDAATEEATIWRGILPSNYGGGGITIDAYWMASSATADNAVLGASFEKGTDNDHDHDTDNFGVESTAAGAANAISGKKTKTTLTISHANMGSPAAGTPYRIKIARKSGDVSDTMTGDLEFVEAHVKET